MDHRQARTRNQNLMLAALCAVGVVGVACAANPRRENGGSGGTTNSGGTSSGGSGGKGGAPQGGTTSSGGKGSGGASGGTSGGGDTGTAVDSGAGGSLPSIDGGQGGAAIDAPIPKPVGCTTDMDCPSGRVCKDTACVHPKACNDSLECGSTDLVCDPNRGFCVQCIRAADCAEGQSCLSNRCASAVKCQNSIECGAGKVCDTSGRCVECSADADCASPLRCVQNVCHAGCDSDKDCTPQGMLCNFTLGVCVQCSAQLPCATGSYCDGSGLCQMAVCLPGEAMCLGNGIASCKPDGKGFGQVSACGASKTCKVYGGVAECAELSAPIDASTTDYDGGGAADGGSPPVTVVGPRACGVPFSASPCTSLPNLVVTQTLDGKGDEFCDVPAFHLNAETAGKVVVHNATPPEDASVKVAWSSAGLAVFIDVVDASVQSVSSVSSGQAIDKCYQGDSIELFVASTSDVKGAPGSDSNTLHVTIPAEGPAVLVKTTTTSEGGISIAHSAWASSRYKQVKTAKGYAIEAQLPWPGSAPATGSLVRFDIGLNSADKSFGGVDDMRDGQLLYYIGQVETSSCPSSEGTIPFCDDRTWCTTLLQ